MISRSTEKWNIKVEREDLDIRREKIKNTIIILHLNENIKPNFS